MKTILSALILIAAGLSSPNANAFTIKFGEIQGRAAAVTVNLVNFNGQSTDVLADTRLMSLYTFDLDQPGRSVCRGNCLSVWPPLNAAAGDFVTAPFGVIMGNNGQPQLTLHGFPLYHYAGDTQPGDVNGHYPKWQLVFVQQ